MPVIKNKNNKAAKTDGLLSLFKTYNKEKVTADGVKKFFTALFYRLGYLAELTVIVAWKKVKKSAYILYRILKRIFKEIRIFTDRLLDGILEDLGLPFARIKGAFIYIKRLIRIGKKDSSRQTGKEVREYVAQGVKNNKQFLPVFVS